MKTLEFDPTRKSVVVNDVNAFERFKLNVTETLSIALDYWSRNTVDTYRLEFALSHCGMDIEQGCPVDHVYFYRPTKLNGWCWGLDDAIILYSHSKQFCHLLDEICYAMDDITIASKCSVDGLNSGPRTNDLDMAHYIFSRTGVSVFNYDRWFDVPKATDDSPIVLEGIELLKACSDFWVEFDYLLDCFLLTDTAITSLMHEFPLSVKKTGQTMAVEFLNDNTLLPHDMMESIIIKALNDETMISAITENAENPRRYRVVDTLILNLLYGDYESLNKFVCNFNYGSNNGDEDDFVGVRSVFNHPDRLFNIIMTYYIGFKDIESIDMLEKIALKWVKILVEEATTAAKEDDLNLYQELYNVSNALMTVLTSFYFTDAMQKRQQ